MLFFSEKVLYILFGSGYIAGSVTLSIISTGYILASLFYYPSLFILNMLNKNNTVMILVVTASIINIILNFLLIPVYGMTGAAISGFVSTLFTSLTFPIISHKYIKTYPFSLSIFKSVFASLISMSILYAIYRYLLMELSAITIPILLILFLTSYFIVLVILKGVEKEDVEILKMLAKKFGVRIDFITKFLKKFV